MRVHKKSFSKNFVIDVAQGFIGLFCLGSSLYYMISFIIKKFSLRYCKIAYMGNVVDVHNLDGKPLDVEESVLVGDADNDVV